MEKASPLLSNVIPFVHKQGNDNVVRLEVDRSDSVNAFKLGIPAANVWELKEASASDNIYNVTLNKLNLEKAADRNDKDCEDYPGMIPCSNEELKKGIRGKFSIQPSSLKEKLETSFFSTPFNVLSTLAFQRYEKEFSGHDNFKAQDCKYCLAIEDQELKLVLASGDIKAKKAVHQKTTTHYIQLLHSEYGPEKVAYAAKICRIDFAHMIKTGEPLTPEHVYRMNMTLNNVETADLKKFLGRLPEFKKAFTDSVRSANSNDDIWDVLKGMKKNPLSQSEIRGIISALRQNNIEVTPKNMIEWLNQFEGKDHLEQLQPSSFDQLTKVFFPPPEDYSKIFTGRTIYYPIKSTYTTAEKGEFKPWVDQQELLQIFPVIQNTDNWDLYYEKLSHVVSKKHLFREHPDKGYITGALIPGPLGKNGEKRWYKVGEAVENGYGVLCYTLQPACGDPSLPLIKLYRSTASDPYALFGKKTIRSDFNPLVLPGYEGKGRTDYYEEEAIRSCTIPVWVGYTHTAKQQLESAKIKDIHDLQPTFANLVAASQELHRCEGAKVSHLSLRDIVQRHGGIINTLYAKRQISTVFFHQLRDRYLAAQTKKRPENFAETQRKDAQHLIKIISQFNMKDFDPAVQMSLQIELDRLAQELNSHLLLNTAQIEKLDHLSKIHDQIFKHIDEIEQAYLAAYKNGDFKTAKELCKTWIEELEKYAKGIREDLASKEKRDLAFTGHSLGGGLSQIYTVHHLMGKGRMPCPGHHCSTYEFDGTGVTTEDNERYKRFFSEHSELLKTCGVNFEVYHQHETGDPVSSIGTHLGSATNLKDAGEVLMNLHFRAAVLKRNPDAKHPTLANVTTAHATQFLEGKEGIDYSKQAVDPYMLGLMESHETMKDFSKKETRQKGEKVRSEVWTIPVSPQTAEKIRSDPALFKLANRMISNWVEPDPQMIQFLDPYGNFYADENGLSKIEKPVASPAQQKIPQNVNDEEEFLEEVPLLEDINKIVLNEND